MEDWIAFGKLNMPHKARGNSRDIWKSKSTIDIQYPVLLNVERAFAFSYFHCRDQLCFPFIVSTHVGSWIRSSRNGFQGSFRCFLSKWPSRVQEACGRSSDAFCIQNIAFDGGCWCYRPFYAMPQPYFPSWSTIRPEATSQKYCLLLDLVLSCVFMTIRSLPAEELPRIRSARKLKWRQAERPSIGTQS